MWRQAQKWAREKAAAKLAERGGVDDFSSKGAGSGGGGKGGTGNKGRGDSKGRTVSSGATHVAAGASSS